MTAVLIKSKLLNLGTSGRESLFREDASCERPGNAGPPQGGRAERGSPRMRCSINYPARLCSGQQPYHSPASASRYQSSNNDICVDSLYNNPNFLCKGCWSRSRDVFRALALPRIPSTPLAYFRLSLAQSECGSKEHHQVLCSKPKV